MAYGPAVMAVVRLNFQECQQKSDNPNWIVWQFGHVWSIMSSKLFGHVFMLCNSVHDLLSV